MSFANHRYQRDCGVNALVDAATSLLSTEKGDRMLMILLAAEDAVDLEELTDALTRAELAHPFFGAVFPGLIDGVRLRHQGALLVSLPRASLPCAITNLEHLECAELATLNGNQVSGGTAIMLIDGLAANTATFLQRVHGRLGSSVSYWGGGAGFPSLQQRPCLFSNEGVFQNGALLAFTPHRAELGVRHGWREVLGPLIVTRAHRNRVAELNWEEALAIYQQTVVDDCGIVIDKENFAEVARSYPFGISRHGAENVVRDPIAVEAPGTLVCVGDVPENTALSILTGSANELITAAAHAAEEACPGLSDERLNLIADCISRSVFLEDRFEEELAAMQAAAQKTTRSVRQMGMLTLGEISSHGDSYLEFFNKTAVVAAFSSDETPSSPATLGSAE